jgi:two-component system sensor histidine kinase VicK
MFRKLAWQLTTSYILVILCSMGILGVYFLSELEDNSIHDLENSVRQQAMLLAGTWSSTLEEGNANDRERRRLWQLAQQLSLQYGSRLRVLDAKQRLIVEAGSGSEPDLAASPAVQDAYAGHEHWVVAPDPRDPSVNVVSLAYPIIVRRPDARDDTHRETVQGVVFASRSTTLIHSTLHDLRRLFFFGTAISLVISGLLSLFMSYYITHPLRVIAQAADRLARGDLSIQVPTSRMNEVGDLADRFNYMARQLGASTGLVLEEKNKLAAVLANMADGVLMMDTHGKVLVMNPSAVEMLGHGRGEAERLLRDGVVRALQAREVQDEEIPLEDDRVARVIYSPVRAEQGGIVGYVVILHDITELRRLAELKTEFVSNVSHELKTPLASIKGLAEILLDGALQEEDGQRFLVSIGREVDRMARLVKDLLNLSKIESGVVKMESRAFDLGALVEDVATHLQGRAHRVKFEVRTAPPARYALGDPDRVEQVVVNLLDNALRYSPSDSTIAVDVRVEAGMCRVDVCDHGIGIPSRDLERIFQRFYRVDKARTREKGGTGLGLAIARQIVDRLGGRIWATSEGEGRGSCFSFTLPLASAEEAQPPSEPRRDPSAVDG